MTERTETEGGALNAVSCDSEVFHLFLPSSRSGHHERIPSEKHSLSGATLFPASADHAFCHAGLDGFGCRVRVPCHGDPNFAAAYSDLARAYLQLGIYFEAPEATMPLAKKNVRRALDIDNTLVDAHINLSVLHFMYEWDWDAAERELFMTSELHPRTAEAFSCASHVLESAGRNVNAEHFIRRGLARDPRSNPLLTELGCNA